ncbi:hypothetical protein IFU30_10975 [Plantibacter sp. CFBP 8798]|uniref:hypothetical protein n=1 Tax=Plantibacter sp. CFBP 8798 TaxID=2775268 RepID=UPI00177AD4E0|nr:hypothetical protein [Plantibacter sp. CFBP 8798]MBD8466790.1 hypothetical protein [Plantibacter sp. CFBP 8798]
MSFDINRLTLGEIAKVEELSSLSISAISNDSAPKGLQLAALAFVAKKRHDPTYLWNDALGLSIDEANSILGLNGDDEETDPKETVEQPTPSEKTPPKK